MKPPFYSVCVALVLGGCGVVSSVFGNGDSANGDPGGSSGIFGPGGDGDGGVPCTTGLCKQQVACSNGGTTSVSGVIHDPAGKNPLYNILVYVPNAPVAPISTGASCDRCGSVSGDPLVTALTDAAGHFQLTNMPVGPNIPLVIQVGKWRRQFTIPNVPQCVDTPLPDDGIRLPRNKSEGDLPQIALTTGGADVMECLLRKVGVDDTEFTTPDQNGRVHFYAGMPYAPTKGDATSSFDTAHGGAPFPQAPSLWDDKATLMKYDIVIFSCEGETYSGDATTVGTLGKPAPGDKSPAALQAFYDYTAAGGRAFASHWHRYWFNTAVDPPHPAGPPSPFESFASWQDNDDPPSPTSGAVNTTFPKGQAMHDWLANVNALTSDQLPINSPKDNVFGVSTSATEWISFGNTKAVTGSNPHVTEYLSFNTPIPASDDQKCGRVVYSDLHVSSGDDIGVPWPGGCIHPDLSPQEKALEFMLFDLSSCIQSDTQPPAPPPTVR